MITISETYYISLHSSAEFSPSLRIKLPLPLMLESESASKTRETYYNTGES